MHLFYHPQASSHHLSLEESRHAAKVLRLKTGDPIELTDGNGHFFKAEIIKTNPSETEFRLLTSTEEPRKDFSIHLAIAPTKNSDRIEWMVEKCIEIGVSKISFLQCKTSERKSINLERLEKIAISAMKQSRRAWLTTIEPPSPFGDFIKRCSGKQKFIAHVDGTNSNQLVLLAVPRSEYVILIGPEGDFVQEELEHAGKHGFQKVSLGPSRLRTETAGLFAVMVLNFVNQK